ncbi:hypothetical protein AX16_010062 [Volvariella volvacea WC 439]|nr:hypothetical protein AX16_010062 [Volvariella volvacea WC 439]
MIEPNASEHTPTCRSIISHVECPPRTWYGADFSPDGLFYDPIATHALSLSHPATCANPTTEQAFWMRCIPRILPNPSRPTYPTARINTIPTELLCDIIRFAAWTPPSSVDPLDDTVLHKGNEQKIDLNPLFLGQVCTHWRNIVRSMPTLWSMIRLHNPTLPQVHLAELYLIRSGSETPLTLSLQQERYLGFNGGPSLASCNMAARMALRLFIPQIHRWRGIDFRLYYEVADSLSQCERFKPEAANILEVAHVEVVEWFGMGIYFENWQQDWEEGVWKWLGSSPALKDVSWSITSPRAPATRWSKVTHLELACEQPGPFFEILPQLQEVQLLRLCIPSWDVIAPPPQASVLPKLHTLELNVSCMPQALCGFTAPALKNVHVISENVFQMDKTSLKNFFLQSGCTITRFDLSTGLHIPARQQENAILEFLREETLRKVEAMRIRAWVGDAVVSYFGEGRFVSLRKLVLTHCDTSDGVVEEMVQARLRLEEEMCVAPLETLRVGLRENNMDRCMISDLVKREYDVKLDAEVVSLRRITRET